MLGRHRRREKRRWGEGRSGATLCPPNDRNPPSPLRRPNPPAQPTSPSLRGWPPVGAGRALPGRLRVQGLPCLVLCHLPLSPRPPIPYPTPMPTRTRLPLTLSLSKGPHLPRLALPCFPLSVCGDPPASPSAPLRRRDPQIRLVPLCRLFRHPPAGPSAPRPARAWQIRLVSLCRLVHRASNPSCAAFPQARAAGKSRAHHSAQFKPNPRRSPAAARCGCRACPAFAVTQ